MSVGSRDVIRRTVELASRDDNGKAVSPGVELPLSVGDNIRLYNEIALKRSVDPWDKMNYDPLYVFSDIGTTTEKRDGNCLFGMVNFEKIT